MQPWRAEQTSFRNTEKSDQPLNDCEQKCLWDAVFGLCCVCSGGSPVFSGVDSDLLSVNASEAGCCVRSDHLLLFSHVTVSVVFLMNIDHDWYAEVFVETNSLHIVLFSTSFEAKNNFTKLVLRWFDGGLDTCSLKFSDWDTRPLWTCCVGLLLLLCVWCSWRLQKPDPRSLFLQARISAHALSLAPHACGSSISSSGRHTLIPGMCGPRRACGDTSGGAAASHEKPRRRSGYRSCLTSMKRHVQSRWMNQTQSFSISYSLHEHIQLMMTQSGPVVPLFSCFRTWSCQTDGSWYFRLNSLRFLRCVSSNSSSFSEEVAAFSCLSFRSALKTSVCSGCQPRCEVLFWFDIFTLPSDVKPLSVFFNNVVQVLQAHWSLYQHVIIVCETS